MSSSVCVIGNCLLLLLCMKKVNTDVDLNVYNDRLTFPALITFSAAYTNSPQRAHFSEPPNFCANLDGFGLVVGRWVWVLVGDREVTCCFLERSLTRGPEWAALCLCRVSMKRVPGSVQELCLHNRFFHNNNHLTASRNTPEDGFASRTKSSRNLTIIHYCSK